jgi:DNA-binding CsgD family transcriptional regulator
MITMINTENRDILYQNALKMLSVREVEVLDLTLDGYTNKEIADILFLSKFTVIVHKRKITEKLGLNGRNALIKWGARVNRNTNK